MKRPVTYAVRQFLIPAGETVSVVRDAGFLTCLDATAPFKVAFDEGSENDFEAGLTYTPVEGFDRVAMRNPTAGPITVRLGFGKGAIADARVVLSSGNTLWTRERPADQVSTGAAIAAASGAVTLLAAADALRREIMVVAPTTATGPVYIGGAAAAAAGEGIPLLPGQSLTLSTGAAIYARNDTGAPVALAVATIGWSA